MRVDLLDPDRQQIDASTEWIKSLFDGSGRCNTWVEWLEKNYLNLDSERCRHYRKETAPWYVPVIEAVDSERFNYISVLGSIGSGKTELLTSLVAASIDMDPGSVIICGQTDHDIVEYGETRLYPVLRGIEALKKWLPLSPKNWRKDFLKMPGRMNLFLCGGNENSLQSKSVRRVFVDEAWLLATGALTYAIGRVHGRENGLVLVTGQGGLAQGEHWHFHQMCQPNIWGWECPECRHIHAYDFKSQVVYQMARNVDNTLNYKAIQESARIVCPHCGTKYKEEDRPKLAGSYVTLPNHARDNAISFQVPALGVPHVTLLDNILRREKGLERMKMGDVSEYRSWKQQFSAGWWEEDFTKPGPLPVSNYSVEDYSDGKKLIENEVARFIACDFQLLKRWVVIRAVDSCGGSRLLNCGDLDTNDELVRVVRHFNIPAENVFLDVGFDSYVVSQLSEDHGYRLWRGSSTESWSRTIDNTNVYHGEGTYIAQPDVKTIKEFVSQPTTMEVRGKQISYKFFSAYHCKDILFKLIQSGKWETAKDVPIEWHEHMQAERKVMRYTATQEPKPYFEKINHNNHMLDCEAMIIAGLVEAKIL